MTFPIVAQSLSHVLLFAAPWTASCQISLSLSISQSLLKLKSIEPVMLSDHLILCHPFLLLPSIFPSIRNFSSESVYHIRWPKDSASALISFRIDWFNILAVQGTLKGLLQHHNLKASVLQCSAFFVAGKTEELQGEIKGCFLLGRESMTNLDSVLKSRDISLLIKICRVKAMVFPVVMYGCESWTIKKAEH